MDRKTAIEQLQRQLFQLKKDINLPSVKAQTDTLTPAQREVMRQLFPHPDGIHVKDLAEHLGISSSAVTQHIDELEKAELVTREISPEDRRSITVKMSIKGRQSANAILKELAKHFEKRLSVLTDHEVETFLHLIEKLTNSNIQENKTK